MYQFEIVRNPEFVYLILDYVHTVTLIFKILNSVIQSLSCVGLFATPSPTACQSSLFFTKPDFAQTHVHWVGDVIQPSHRLSSPSLLAFNLSQHQGLFQWVGSSHKVVKVLKLQNQHQPFQWIFRIDWFDLLAVQGTLKRVLQHYSLKASIQ